MSVKAWCGMYSALAREAVLGLSKSTPYQGNTEGGEGSAPPPLAGILLGDFPLSGCVRRL